MPKMTKSGRGAGTAVETKELRALRKAREEVAAQYKVSGNGIVRDPGPLEGQPLYVAHYFDAEEADEEFADEFSRDVAVIFPSAEDRIVFPELNGGVLMSIAALWIWETDSGLVLSRLFATEAEEKSARDEIDQARDDEGESGEGGEEDDEDPDENTLNEDAPEDYGSDAELKAGTPPDKKPLGELPKRLSMLANDPRVKAIDDERDTADGYWLYLKPGWNYEGAHIIHETTAAEVEARFKRIVKCEPGCDCNWEKTASTK